MRQTRFRKKHRILVFSSIVIVSFLCTIILFMEWGIIFLVPDLKNLVIPDAELSYRLKPDSRTIDLSAWFWDGKAVEYRVGKHNERVLLNSSEISRPLIACYGDSMTFGLDVPWEDSYPAKLSSHLGKQVSVINFGVPAFNAFQSCKYAAQGIEQWAPDILILQICQNDDEPEMPVNRIYSGRFPPCTRLGWLARLGILFLRGEIHSQPTNQQCS